MEIIATIVSVAFKASYVYFISWLCDTCMAHIYEIFLEKAAKRILEKGGKLYANLIVVKFACAAVGCILWLCCMVQIGFDRIDDCIKYIFG